MRSLHHSLIIVGVAFLLVGAAISPAGQTAIETTTDTETVGEADALFDQVNNVVPFVVGGASFLCDHFCPGDPEKVESTDAEQAKIDIYSSAAATHDTSETYLTSHQNYLEDSHEVALMVGKNAAIRAYQNESTEIQSEQAARDAIEDYYSLRQQTLIDNWDTSVAHFDYLDAVSGNESGLQNGSQGGIGEYYTDLSFDTYDDELTPIGVAYQGNGSETLTLLNGTTTSANTVEFEWSGGGGTTTAEDSTGLVDGIFVDETGSGQTDGEVSGMLIRSSQISGGDYSDLDYVEFNEYSSAWSDIESQESSASDEVVTFVNSTYDEWESGAINESDLIDPYLGSREYSPEDDFQSWALSSYSTLGLDSPANLSSFGSMTITSDNDTVDGILMSDGTPEGDTFETGVTYNTENLTGHQYVIGAEQAHDLEGEFVIESMRDADGNDLDETVYRNVTYETSNLSQYQEISDELADLRAEIEAEKQDALPGGGGWWDGLPNPLGFLGGIGNMIMLIGGAMLLFALLSVMPRN